MIYYTTNTYTLKRKILAFSNKISRHLFKPEKKFTTDMTYGMFASCNCLHTDIVDHLHKTSQKFNSIDRLTRHLNNVTSVKTLHSYLSMIRKCVPVTPIIHIDGSDMNNRMAIKQFCCPLPLIILNHSLNLRNLLRTEFFALNKGCDHLGQGSAIGFLHECLALLSVVFFFI